jgi:16S rRNA (guanine527-N7)-methyltransferase
LCTLFRQISDGIKALQKSDKDIEKIISRREEEILSLLEKYVKEIEAFNEAYGLMSVDSTEELVARHILDSLAPLGIISRLLEELRANNSESSRTKIADAGSGAGLPGIPLAITLPEYDFTLIERMGRRAGFLLNTKAVLGLSNVTVEEKELEKVTISQFNLIIFRAFKPLEPKLLKTLFKVCVPGGIIAAYKGRKDKIETEMAPLEKLCGSWEAIPYKVPFLEEERHLAVIKKH